MIEVRIRKETEPTTHAVTICSIPVGDIQELIDSVLEWGLFFDGGDGLQVSLAYQYVYYNSEAYFELVICERSTEKQPAAEEKGDDVG